MTSVVCTACQEQLACGSEAQKAHYKSDRHQYNVKRKMEGLPPIPEAVWEAKLARFAEMQAEQGGKKKDHIKDKSKKKNKNGTSNNNTGNFSPSKRANPAPLNQCQPATTSLLSDNSKKEQNDGLTSEISYATNATGIKIDPHNIPNREIPIECRSLFDGLHFRSMETNLEYMRKKYTFTIPERAYCHDVPGLMKFLHKKISDGHTCLYCDKVYESERDCRQHMIDKNHCRIGTEGYTRKGNYSANTTNELLAQMEPFYDFSQSYKELRLPERMDAQKKLEADKTAAAIMDASNGDKALEKAKRAKMLIRIIEHFADSENNLDRNISLDFAQTGKFYHEFFTEGEMDPLTDEQFQMWTKDFGGKFDTKALEQFFEIFECDVEEEFERFLETYYEDELEAMLEEKENAEVELLKNDETKELIECEDEAEFEKVMAAYGLKPAKVLPDGSLRLPDGSIAGHRKWNYLYKQKGVRMDPELIEERRRQKMAITNHGFGARMMLGNGQHTANSRAANNQIQLHRMAYGELKKQGKQVVAILKRQQKDYMQVGVKKNKMPKNNQGIAMYYCG